MSTSATHNAIMEACGKDSTPMLIVGSYIQWKSRIRRYIATRPNHDLINHCIDNGPYEFQMMDHPAKEATEIHPTQPTRRGLETYSSVMESCDNAKEIWLAIERLMQGKNTNKQDVETKLFWEFGKFTSQDEWQRFMTIVKQGQDLKTVSYHKLFDILKQHQNELNEIQAKRFTRNANPLALVATTQQQPNYYPPPKPIIILHHQQHDHKLLPDAKKKRLQELILHLLS
ncbi:hypothetical protein Tco_0060695 [Tanacetum coccineum]